jgi:UDP-3-O-[3-hydroxymyristoyl] glucosamine N-acyltransferase
MIGAMFEGDGDLKLRGAAALESAGPRQISFIGNRKAAKEAGASMAGCLVVPQDFANESGRTVIRAKDPRGAFAKIVRKLHPEAAPRAGVHPTAVIGELVELGAGVSVGPNCYVGDRVQIGAGTVLHANVSVYADSKIGERCVLHSGVVIGADGFGLIFERDHYEKFPQIGRVVVGNDVEIGANSTVDRAALGETVVSDGVKLDNMVHIGHNCRIGKHVVIAAQTGVAGGAVIEDYAILGGQVGVADNVTIQSRAIVGAKTGIPSGKILKGGGATYWGLPARPLKEYLEGVANLYRFPELKAALDELARRVDEIEKKR